MTRGLRTLCSLCLFTFTTLIAVADTVPLRTDVQGDRPQISILNYNTKAIQFEVRLPAIERLQGTLEGRLWDRIEIPGGGYELDLGAPEVPHFTRLLAIPAGTGVRAEFEALETTVLQDIDLMPAQGKDPVDLENETQPVTFDLAAYSRDAFYPEEEVMIGPPALMRGIRLVGVRMHPVRYNPVSKELRVTHRYQVTVYFEGMDDRNVPVKPLRPITRSWAKLMQRTVINYDNLDLDITETGSYLIVCENNSDLLNNILPPLVDWKKRKGHSVAVETFTPGASNTTIKGIIQNAYDNWNIPPEYVLLFGDCTGTYELPGWTVGGWPWGSDEIDQPYSQLEGNDELADVAVGRLPAGTDYEATVLVNKVLYYEKMPYIDNTDWYHEGVLIAGNGASGISTVQTNRYIKTRMVWNEYTEIDTFWYWMGGSVAGTLSPAINEGVSIANYRGCYEMENFTLSSINALYNGRKLPFVVTITCGTGGFSGYSESLMERFSVVGTPTNPSGAVACVGTATSYTHTRQNNTIDMGIFAGIFDEGLTQAGNALNRGKLELYNTYQAHDPSSVENFSKYAALAGDPGLELFNRAIQFMDCSIPASVIWGENVLTLSVSESGVGPLEDAIVCFYKDNDIHEVGLTDASGQVTLPISPTAPGNVKVTITKQNFNPIVDSLNVVQADVSVGYYDHSIDDDNGGSSSGNSNGIINPTETVEIPLVLKNFGSSTSATGISVAATTSDEYATLIDDFETFPNIAPNGTGNSADDFDLAIAPDCPHGHTIRLNLTTDSDQGSWDGVLDLDVISYLMTITSVQAAGADTLLSPGETTDLILWVTNDGGEDALSLTATIASTSPYVTINDNSAAFATVGVGGTSNCATDPFNLTASVDTPPGYPAALEVTFTGANGAVQVETITIPLGAKSSTDPQGPDEYGYWCFDDTDQDYLQAPTHIWVELDPSYGGSGTQLPISDPSENTDMSVNVTLPFTFRYYGEETDEITVCSNGWISTRANNSFSDFRNYPIPSCIGPNGMIAAFWDDLITWSGGHVYTWYDASQHRFVIEWSRMKTLGYPNTQETFEIILFDPAYHPTVTGDGPILFQYYSIADVYGLGDDNPYSTVGIERPDQQDGIEIVYWNTYEDPATAQLCGRRAYLFTTDFDYITGPTELIIEVTYISGSPVPAAGGDLHYGVYVENQGIWPLDFYGWIEIAYEGGPPTIIILRSFTNFQPGWTVNRPDVVFPVPASYAAGDYTLTGKLGVFPDVVWEESGFSWSKLGDHGDGSFIPWAPEGLENPFEEIITFAASETVPEEFSFSGAYPNPFNPRTTLTFALPEAAKAGLKVYDISGRQVAELVNGWRDAGVHEVEFDASDYASGVYICRLQAGNYSAVQKMVLLK